MPARFLIPFLFSSLIVACGGAPPQGEARSPVPVPTPESIPSTLSDARKAIEQGKLELGESALLNLASSDDPTTRNRALARLALFYQEQGRTEESVEAYRKAIDSYPQVAPILSLRLTEVWEKEGQIESAIATALSIIEKYPASAAAASATLKLPHLYTLAEDEEKATASFARTSEVTIDSLNDEEFVGLADQLEKHGRRDLATALRMRIVSDFPQSRFTEKLYGQLTSLPAESSPIAKLTFQESVGMADRLGRVNRYDQALDLIRRIEKRFPSRVTDPSLRYTRVVSHFNSRRYPEVVAETPVASEPYYREIQLRRAHAFWRMDRGSEFVALAKQIMARHPGTREATAAKLLLSKYHTTDDIKYDRAISLLGEVIAEGNLGNDGDNIWTLGWMYAQAGRDDEALATFEKYLARFPDADYTSNSLFWTGKIHERNGRIADRDAAFRRLIDFYPYTYYSYRAREILGDTTLPRSISNPRYVFPDIESAPPDPRLDTIRELTEIGLAAEAAREMQRLSNQSSADPLLAWRMADLYAEIGEPLRANQILQRSFRDIVRHGGTRVPERFWQILYPRPFWDHIQASARHSAIEPNLITAITRQESAFNPDVVSNAGAVGLMQIMPEEASRIAQAGGLPPVTRQDLFDPRTNIMVGGAEIRQKLDSMGGHPVLAIASYNAGEIPVRRWMGRTPLADIDVFIESISYAETKLYVKNVTRNLYEYRRVYETD